MPHLKGSAYAHHSATKRAWHDGSALLDAGLMLAYEGKLMAKVYNVLGLKRPKAVRQFFANKGG